MGSKIPLKGKDKKGTHKCPKCLRKFPSAPALKCHIISSHPKGRAKTSMLNNKTNVSKNVTKPDIKPKPSTDTANVESIDSPDVVKDNGEPKKEVNHLKRATHQCPYCSTGFSSLVGLLNHKRVHLKKNELNKSCKPLETEVEEEEDLKTDVSCKCFKVEVDNFLKNKLASVVCGDCKKEFKHYVALLTHIDSVHREELLSMFFPTETSFQAWKTEMEYITKTTFQIKRKLDTRQLYVCTEHIHSENELLYIQCPSRIVTRYYSSGIQVYYMKKHWDHSYLHYTPGKHIEEFIVPTDAKVEEKDVLHKKFRYVMDHIMRKSMKIGPKELEPFYEMAQDMENKMVDIINIKQESTDDGELQLENGVSRKSVDAEDTSAADSDIEGSPPSKRAKEKPSAFTRKTSVSELIETDVNKSAPGNVEESLEDCNDNSPKIVNTFTLAGLKDVEDMAEIFSQKVDEIHSVAPEMTSLAENGKGAKANTRRSYDSKPKERLRSRRSCLVDEVVNSPKLSFDDLLKTSSFNDSYKNFIEKVAPNNKHENVDVNMKNDDELACLDKDKGATSLTAVTESDESSAANVSFNIENRKKSASRADRERNSTEVNGRNDSNLLSPKHTKPFYSQGKTTETHYGEGDNVLMDNNNKELLVEYKKKPSSKKKLTVKTKLGQFSPSPKRGIQPHTNKRPKLNVAKKTASISNSSSLHSSLFHEYEVKEQDNDCNILILKF